MLDVYQVYTYKILKKNMKKHSCKTFKAFSVTNVRRPGIEPRSTAWKAAILTITPSTLAFLLGHRKHAPMSL